MAKAPLWGRQFGIRLTAAEDELIKKEKKATGASSLSSVFERALLDIVTEREELAKTGLVVPPVMAAHGELMERQFRLHEETLRLLDETAAVYGWNKQLLTRAAMLRLAQVAETRERAREKHEDDPRTIGAEAASRRPTPARRSPRDSSP